MFLLRRRTIRLKSTGDVTQYGVGTESIKKTPSYKRGVVEVDRFLHPRLLLATTQPDVPLRLALSI